MNALTDLAHQCAVTMGKSENMRVTAGKFAVQALDMLKTDQGVMDAVEAGVEPTLRGFHILVSRDPSYPPNLRSFSSFRRVLQIAKAKDPEAEDARLREEQAERDQVRYKSDPSQSTNVTEWQPSEKVHHPVEAEFARIEATLTTDQFIQLTKKMVARCNQIAAERKADEAAYIQSPAMKREADFGNPNYTKPGSQEYQDEVAEFYAVRRGALK
jgi:hypothetical protein